MKIGVIGLSSANYARHAAELISHSKVAVIDMIPPAIHAPAFPGRMIVAEAEVAMKLEITAPKYQDEFFDFKKQRGKHRGRNSGAFGNRRR